MFWDKVGSLVVERPSSSDVPPMPWERQPRRLWSRLDMKPIQTAEIARAVANIAIARGNASTVPLSDALIGRVLETVKDQLAKSNITFQVHSVNDDAVGNAIRPRVIRLLEAVEEGLSDAALPKRFHDKVERVKRAIQERETFDGTDAGARLEELMYDLLGELTEPQFLRISVEMRPYFEQTEPLFGTAVSDQFPDSNREIAAAGRCYAFGEWTACVFHLMRALELALHKWALELGVTQFSAIELENWKNILDAADKKTRALEQQPKSLQKDRELQYYGETCAHFRSIKDAWRNHVAHSRTTYDGREAEAIMMHVKEFMRLLANRP
jgi:hypothetical protein